MTNKQKLEVLMWELEQIKLSAFVFDHTFNIPEITDEWEDTQAFIGKL